LKAILFQCKRHADHNTGTWWRPT